MGQSWDRYVVLASRGIENWEDLDELTQYILYKAHIKREEGSNAPSDTQLVTAFATHLWVPKVP